MKRIIILLALAAGVASASVSSCTSAQAQQPLAWSVINTDSFKSDILKETVKFNVYLPVGYDASSEEKYPVIYLLHGLTDTYDAWATKGHMKDVVDELIASGECRKVVIIMPNAGHPDCRKVLNGYFNQPGRNYEDFFFQEFLPAVEERYKIVGDKQHRAIMGLSMGGGGSTVYSQRHPDMFSSCYCMSGWLDEPYIDESEPRDMLYQERVSVHEHSALDYLANADEATLEQLRSVKWFFDCGDDDFLLDLTMKMHMLMREKGVKSELRVRDGWHGWEYWHLALRLSLPFASRNFGE